MRCAALLGMLVTHEADALTLRPMTMPESKAVLVASRPESARYVVSVVLRRNGAANEIKLVQSVPTAISADAALGVVTKEALAQYPGYSILSTLVSPLADRPAPCGFQANI